MQSRPDKLALLEAVMEFLLAEVHPRIEDKGLSFRVLIAANLVNVVSSELRTEDASYHGEVSRLADLLPELASKDALAVTGRAERRGILAKLDAALSEELRRGHLTDDRKLAIRAHLQTTLREALANDNPRFDTSFDIEGQKP